MFWRKHRLTVFACCAIVFLCLAISFLVTSSPPAAVSLTFLQTTNDEHYGKTGLFQIVNHLNETVRCDQGFYKPASRPGLNSQMGDAGALVFGKHQFTANTTNVIEIWIPPNGGPYKLVLRCLPESKATAAFTKSIRVRFFSFISPYVKPSFATQSQWYGSIFAESQSFEATD